MAGHGSECRDWAVIAASSPLVLHNRFAAFIIVSSSTRVIDFCVFDLDVNYSDHLPLVVALPCPLLHKVAINSKESEPI